MLTTISFALSSLEMKIDTEATDRIEERDIYTL